MDRRSSTRWRGVALVAIGVSIGLALAGTPANAHVTGSVAHIVKHLKKSFFTKSQSDARYINIRERAADADLLDGADSTAFLRSGSAAGGDLAGSYPSPTLRDGAVSAAKLAPPEAWREVGQPGQPSFDGCSLGNYGDPHNTVAFYKDPYGVVHLKGLVFNTHPASGQGGNCAMVFRLPEGYRPAATEIHIVLKNGDAPARVDIERASDPLYAGVVRSTTIVDPNGWFSLDGISFRAAN